MLKYLRGILTYQCTFCAELSPVRCYLFPAQQYEVDHGSYLPFYVKSVIEILLGIFFPRVTFIFFSPKLYSSLVKDLVRNNIMKMSSFGNLLPNIWLKTRQRAKAVAACNSSSKASVIWPTVTHRYPRLRICSKTKIRSWLLQQDWLRYNASVASSTKGNNVFSIRSRSDLSSHNHICI